MLFRAPQLPYRTDRDETLLHQVEFTYKNMPAEVHVSCNCRRVRTSGGHVTFESMGQSSNIEQSRELYNDPDNHRQPFDPEVDGAKW